MLRDDLYLSGNKIVDFETETQKMVDCTKLKEVSSAQIEFLAYCSVPSAQRVDAYPFYRLTESSIERFLNGESLSVSYIKKTYAPDLLEECVNIGVCNPNTYHKSKCWRGQNHKPGEFNPKSSFGRWVPLKRQRTRKASV